MGHVGQADGGHVEARVANRPQQGVASGTAAATAARDERDPEHRADPGREPTNRSCVFHTEGVRARVAAVPATMQM